MNSIERAEKLIQIFNHSIQNYHILDQVDQEIKNPFEKNTIEYLLYNKNWIDTVQWHLEDHIRSPKISGEEIIGLKRRIDQSNQDRTNIVEKIDDWFYEYFKNIEKPEGCKMNSETPAWLMDRISILLLKIFHMEEQANRIAAGRDHVEKCKVKLKVLLEQKSDLSKSYDELFEDLISGKKFMKVYRQVKMYNDATLNPMLYKESEKEK